MFLVLSDLPLQLSAIFFDLQPETRPTHILSGRKEPSRLGLSRNPGLRIWKGQTFWLSRVCLEVDYEFINIHCCNKAVLSGSYKLSNSKSRTINYSPMELDTVSPPVLTLNVEETCAGKVIQSQDLKNVTLIWMGLLKI